jgi:hypothetical protein
VVMRDGVHMLSAVRSLSAAAGYMLEARSNMASCYGGKIRDFAWRCGVEWEVIKRVCGWPFSSLLLHQQENDFQEIRLTTLRLSIWCSSGNPNDEGSALASWRGFWHVAEGMVMWYLWRRCLLGSREYGAHLSALHHFSRDARRRNLSLSGLLVLTHLSRASSFQPDLHHVISVCLIIDFQPHQP